MNCLCYFLKAYLIKTYRVQIYGKKDTNTIRPLASWNHLIFNNIYVVNGVVMFWSDKILSTFIYYRKDHRNESKTPVAFLVTTKHSFLLMSFRPYSVYVVVFHS